MANQDLYDYIEELISQQNLSLRQASLRCDLAPETISKMIRDRKTSTPWPSTIKALAEGLGGSYLHMMRLAGHIPDDWPVDVPDEMRATLEHLAELWAEIQVLDPSGDGRARLEAIAIQQAEMVLAALRSAIHHTERQMP